MLDARSSLASAKPYSADGIVLADAPGFTLTQYAWFAKPEEKAIKVALGALPAKVGQTAAGDHGLILRIGPRQVCLIAEGRTASAPSAGVTTPLSSSRTRIALSGAQARELLSRCAAIDFDASVFKPGQFVLTGIHHTPVLIHCTGESAFHIYAMRSFGMAVWEWLEDAAHGV